MTALKTGQKTYKQIAAENGRDWRSQIDDMAEVIAYGAKKGVDMGGVLFGNKGKETQKKPVNEGGGDGKSTKEGK